jgi:hypothetical protein
VTIGAYANAAQALGLRITAAPLPPHGNEPTHPGVRVGDWPQLQALAWHLDDDTPLTEAEALALYERNWRHIDHDAMTRDERLFIQHLTSAHGHGVLNV